MSLKITIERAPLEHWFDKACATTSGNGERDLSHIFKKLLRAQHSPPRTQMYAIDIEELKTSASVHFVRHNVGVQNFVKTMRDDNIKVEIIADRNTPVRHLMILNAQALCNIAEKRLCYKAHAYTRHAMELIWLEMKKVHPELAEMMIPACVRCGGRCPEESNSCGMVKQMWQTYKGVEYWKNCPSVWD